MSLTRGQKGIGSIWGFMAIFAQKLLKGVCMKKCQVDCTVGLTFVLIVEMTEVNWTGDGDNFSHLGSWPAG